MALATQLSRLPQPYYAHKSGRKADGMKTALPENCDWLRDPRPESLIVDGRSTDGEKRGGRGRQGQSWNTMKSIYNVLEALREFNPREKAKTARFRTDAMRAHSNDAYYESMRPEI